MTKKKSPKVIFNSLYTLGFNNVDNKFSNNKKSIKRVLGMYDYYTNEEKRAMSMYDYYTGKLTKENTVNLVLENGSVFSGERIGYNKDAICEIVFNTSMTGYLEIFTDPSYASQGVVMT